MGLLDQIISGVINSAWAAAAWAAASEGAWAAAWAGAAAARRP